MPSSGTPLDLEAKRASQYLPGITAAKVAVGLQDHKRMLESAAKRVDESHALQMSLLKQGLPNSETAEPTEEEMGGNISIAGDITNNYTVQAEPKAITPAPQTPSILPVSDTAKNGLSGLAKTGIVAAMLAGIPLGAAIPSLWAWWNRPAAVAKDAGARVRIFWGSTELQPDKPLTTSVEEKSK